MDESIAREKTLAYFDGDEIATSVWLGKYALRDADGALLEETPADMHRRLAKEFARIEAKYPNPMSEGEIFELLDGFKYVVPQGSPMSGVGNGYKIQSLSNCFVIPPPLDSYAGILHTDQQQVQIMKRRGGVGFDISNIRPRGLKTANAAGTTDGISIFLERFSNSCREVAQCIAADQRVLVEGEGLTAIQDVVPDQKVWTRVGFVPVVELKRNGEKQVGTTRTKFGFTFRSTEDHVVTTVRDGEWIESRIKDLRSGDPVVVIPGTPIRKELQYLKPHAYSRTQIGNLTWSAYEPAHLPITFSEDLAYFCGYSWGDGSVERSKHEGKPRVLSLACGDAWPNIKLRLQECARLLWGKELTTRRGDGALDRLDLYSMVVLSLLEENGLLKGKAETLRVPEIVWNSGWDVQASFLAGLFDADGYASGKKKGFTLSTVSKGLAEDAQKLLMSMGIVSKIHCEPRDHLGWRALYSVSITGKHAQSRFGQIFEGRSIKVFEKPFIADRDNYKTPFTAEVLGVRRSKLQDNIPMKGSLSVAAYESLGLPEEVLIVDQFLGWEPECVEPTYDLVLAEEHLFWCEGLYVHNSGRRGALMLTIDCRHPEIENFISIKKDLTKVTGANISIRVTNAFMEAVRDDGDFTLQWPVESDTPTVTRTVKAADIWKQMMEAAHGMAEPGILFWDTVIENSPADCYAENGFKSKSTNPCQPEFASVLTPAGIRRFSEIDVGSTIWSGMQWAMVSRKVYSGVKPVYAYETNAGTFFGTAEHKVFQKGLRVEADAAKTIDVSIGARVATSVSSQHVVDGWVIGDGTVHKASGDLVLLCLGSNDSDFLLHEHTAWSVKKHRRGISPYMYEVITDVTAEELPLTFNRVIPNRYMMANSEVVASFLRGLYSANGSLCGGRITLKATSKALIRQVQVLLSSLGIRSYITTNKPAKVEFSNGEYLCKKSYDLNITSDRHTFRDLIGFVQKYKADKLDAYCEIPTTKGKTSYPVTSKVYI